MNRDEGSKQPEREELDQQEGWEGRGARESDYVPIKTHGREDGEGAGIKQGGEQPSDEDMKKDLLARLRENGDVQGSRIEVEVKDGEITLRGSVPNYLVSQMAESVANEVPGVTDVHNELDVQAGPEAEESPRQD